VRYTFHVAVSVILLTAVSCVESEPPARPPVQPSANIPAAPDSIGQAWLDDDGTLKLQLRVEGPGDIIGDRLIAYPPDDQEYKNTLRHVGGLKKGEVKPVPPWPNEEPQN